ncbi:MAG: hypothetical protein WD995_03730 [Gemmatimonadota bacterium]
MIFKKYGETYQSVETNFDSKALNEISFRRNREESFPEAEFETRHEPVEVHELVAEAEGDVQDATEQAMLDQLLERLEGLDKGLDPGAVLVVENEPGHDHPKTRQTISNVVVAGENRLRFHYTVAPPLRVAVHRPRA